MSGAMPQAVGAVPPHDRFLFIQGASTERRGVRACGDCGNQLRRSRVRPYRFAGLEKDSDTGVEEIWWCPVHDAGFSIIIPNSTRQVRP
jgi:hypothetical protein